MFMQSCFMDLLAGDSLKMQPRQHRADESNSYKDSELPRRQKRRYWVGGWKGSCLTGG